MVVALAPLHKAAKIKRIVVATYQSVSGAGKEGLDELYDQTKAIYMNDRKEPKKFSKAIAFNVIPQIDSFMDDGSTKEEWKMVVETKKILDSAIEVSATCVRVPVFVGHSEAVNVEFEYPLSAEDAYDILLDAEGVSVSGIDEREMFVTPAEISGEDGVFVSRLRNDPSVKHGLSMWVVADNVRKGAATNAVQIAETLIEQYGLKPQAKQAA
jgi:aspartate-semialdehyde dehydrogenase